MALDVPVTITFFQSTIILSSTLATDPVATPVGSETGEFSFDYSQPGTLDDVFSTMLQSSDDNGATWQDVSAAGSFGVPSSGGARLRTPLSALYRMSLVVSGSITATAGVTFA